ncbi:hypothetical protein GGD81_001875 [Rhodobium orientis]|uniref:Uncharacterized protein n=1 Tax=Rhodobium orientis TaxID=34017 RepID=A0A327JSH7_9HYPH|nr:hypothetical protein [Rhodobium orientis]MBB4302839.1 hypothetical protein [Rhodobium orientis]RAI26258.1 hypothetical protein CH339_14825 [Rhodobium orientis]
MFEYKQINVFPFAYLFLLIASLIKMWNGFDLDTLNIFDNLFSDEGKRLVPAILNWLLVSFVLYIFSSYLLLEKKSSQNIEFQFQPNRFFLYASRYIRVLLVLLLSVKIMTPSNADYIFVFISFISLLLVAERIFLLNLLKRIKLSENSLYSEIQNVPITDIFCFLLGLLSMVIFSTPVIVQVEFVMVAFVTFCVFMIGCTGGSLWRLAQAYDVLTGMASSLTEPPKIRHSAQEE